MIAVHIEAPYATFRKSFARGFAESFPFPPPATIYGMLLSLVGESQRSTHEGARLAFAFKRIPLVATTLRKLSRLKYGVASKQSSLGNQPDFIETLCGIDMVCWIDSSDEKPLNQTLEQRVQIAIQNPEEITRYGVLCLGLSDDSVDEVACCEQVSGQWFRLIPADSGTIELPIWVDHVGSVKTKWQRYNIDLEARDVSNGPTSDWRWTSITAS